jgi:hypothetical protein
MKFLISEQEKIRILEMHQNATSKHLLMEQPDVIQTMTVKVPITKGKDNVERFAANSNVEVSLTDGKGEGTNTRLGEFKSIQLVRLGETQINTGTSLTNFRYTFLASDRKLQNYLFNNIGKKYEPWDNEAQVSLVKKTGGSQVFKCEVTFVKNLIPTQK